MLMHDKAWVAGLAMAVGLACAAPGYGQTAAGRPAGLNFTDAQREQIRTLRDAQRNDERALREKMRAAREQLRQTMRADVPDEAAVRSAAGAVAALQADQATLRARSRAQFMKVLTPDQQARMKQARARLEQRSQRMMRHAMRTGRAMQAGRTMRAERQMQVRRNQMMRRNQALRQWRWWI